MFKSRETYYIENTELRETERGETKKLFIETENQTNWVLIEAHKKEEVVLGEKAKVLECFFKKLTKFLIDKDGSTKEL